MTSPAQSIDELVRPLATAAGLELWDVEVNPRVVRVLADRAGGIDLESLAGLARAVSAALDAREDLTPSRNYQLEVSSPGLERALRTSSHFQRYVGATVAVKTAVLIDGSRRLQGVLVAADDAGITLGQDEATVVIAYHQIQKAHTVLVWGPTAKKSGAPNSAAQSKSRARSGDRRATTPAAAAGPPERVKDVAR